MPNPFEPAKSPPLATTPLEHYPEFLPPSSFNSGGWPTWESLEASTQALIANTHSDNINTADTHTYTMNNSSAINIEPTTPLRKRRFSKPADARNQSQLDRELLLGEAFRVSEVVEALKGGVEVERVVGRLLEWRRVNQSVGMGEGRVGGRGKGVRGEGSNEDGKGVAE